MTDQDPGFGELNRSLGRIEKVLDRMDEKLDGHSEILAGYAVRLDTHDKAIAELHHSNQQQQEHRNTERRHRMQLWGAVIAAIVGSGALEVLNLLMHK